MTPTAIQPSAADILPTASVGTFQGNAHIVRNEVSSFRNSGNFERYINFRRSPTVSVIQVRVRSLVPSRTMCTEECSVGDFQRAS
jgi:hypothetical protein